MKPGVKSMILIFIGLGLLLFSGFDILTNNSDDSVFEHSNAESSVFFLFIGGMLILAGVMGIMKARKQR